MLVFLNVLYEGISELDKKGIKEVDVFLEDSFIVIHDNSLEYMVVDLDGVNDLLEYLRENLEDLREFSGFEDTLKCFESFKDVDFAKRHLCSDEFVIDSRRVVTNHSN